MFNSVTIDIVNYYVVNIRVVYVTLEKSTLFACFKVCFRPKHYVFVLRHIYMSFYAVRNESTITYIKIIILKKNQASILFNK